MKNIDIIKACSDLGVHIDGASLGPEKIIENIKSDKINKIFTEKAIILKKDIRKENLKKNIDELNEFNSKLYETVLLSLNNNKFPITIGGDHSIAIASALAAINKYKKLGVLWIDAHGDFNTLDTTITGNIHGLPLAAITGYEKKYLTEFHKGSFYRFENIVIIGGRDIDELEQKNLEDANIKVFSTNQINKLGMKKVMEEAIKIASKNTEGIHISYDLDVIDPQIAMGVSVPAENGINLEQVKESIFEIVKNKKIIKSFDLVEYNPLKDQNDNTLNIAQGIIVELLKHI